MIRRAAAWIRKQGTPAEWAGDILGALSLFFLLWAGLWAAAIFGG
jgi:hypothetical protein